MKNSQLTVLVLILIAFAMLTAMAIHNITVKSFAFQDATKARLDRLETATNILYQYSPYKAHATAQFDTIWRTNTFIDTGIGLTNRPTP